MTTQPIRNKNHVRELAGYWLKRGNLRNYALVVLGVCTALRIGDLLRLKWQDAYDESHGEFRTHIDVTERKTGKQKTIALNSQAVKALMMLLPYRRNEYIFASNRISPAPISRVHAWRVVKVAAEAIGITGQCISPHSMRKTIGYFAWKSGVHPSLIMDIYGHTSYEVTRRYLGISQDERDRVYLGLALF